MSHEASQAINFFPPSEGLLAMQLHIPIRIGHTISTPIEEQDLFDYAFEDWTFAVAVQVGELCPQWTLNSVFAVYCAKAGGSRDWQRRYGINGKYFSSDLYDTVEGFLVFYAQSDRETEEIMLTVIEDLDL